MGLAGTRKRQNISHDPNNTAWTRSTTSYGSRILSSHGWSAGQTLGAIDAAHAPHYTDASSSHIRTQLREENLGLGANAREEIDARNVQRMGAFNDVLSRLNGNVDEVEQGKKRKAREDLGRKLYVEAKFGRMRFVRAGFLVGGEITPKESEQPLDGTGMPESELGPSLTTGKAEKKRRKEERSKKKRRKEDLGRREEHPDNIDAEADTTTITILKHDLHNEPKKQRRKAENRAQKEQRRGGARDNEKIEPFADASAVSYGREMDHETAENDKNNKRACREAKRQKKRARNQSSEHTSSAEDSSAPSTMEPCVMARQNTDAVIGTAVATQAKLSNGRGMQAVRRRYIQHKGMAGMDAEAMREILMVKAG